MVADLRYPGEDIRPTSDRELRGWYLYAVAAEVFAVCGVGAFLPVTLEQLARETGFLRSNPTQACVQATVPAGNVTLPLGNVTSSLMRRADSGEQCVVNLLGGEISTASFAMYTFSLAVAVQAIVLVSISAIADHGHWRKKLLLILAYTGSTACICFIFIVPAIYFLGSLLVVIAVASLGTSMVLLNSFLPLLVANHPTVRDASASATTASEAQANGHRESSDGASLDLPYPPKPPPYSQPNKASPQLQLSNKISANGVSIGYISAVSVQILCIVILVLFNKLAPSIAKSTFPLRVILTFVGLWWAVFTIPPAMWMRPRPGPPLTAGSSKSSARNALSYVWFAWRSLWNTFRIALKLKQAWRFLIAWFIMSDAIATIQGTAILFAKTELHMATEAVAVISVLAMAGGITGAAVWPIIARRYGLQANHVIIGCLLLFETIPTYGLLAYIPFIKAWGVIGIQKPWEILVAAFIFGLAMGGLSSYCRSLFGILIPPGSEAAFYALYAFTDKGSSVVGPTIVGRIVDATGSIRPSFWFLAVLNLLPLPLVYFLDAEAGRQDAVAMAGSLGKGMNTQVEQRVHDEEGEELLERRSEQW